MDGYTFGLSPSSKRILSQTLAGEQVVFGNVFVGHGTKSDFEAQYGPIAKHILLTVLGINRLQLTMLKEKVSTVRLEEAVSHQAMHEFALKDVEAQ